MVRINLIDPRYLSDQHLIAEYNEMLMLLGQLRKYPNMEGCGEYCLGKGHIRFFRDKLSYLKKRHGLLKEEMRKRGFKARKTADISKFPKSLRNQYSPDRKALSIIKKRLVEKLTKKKGFYRYHGRKRDEEFLVGLIRKS